MAPEVLSNCQNHNVTYYSPAAAGEDEDFFTFYSKLTVSNLLLHIVQTYGPWV